MSRLLRQGDRKLRYRRFSILGRSSATPHGNGAYRVAVVQREGFRDWLDRLHPAGLLYSTYEQRLIAELDKTRLPKHVAVLADGNRRWARLNAPGETLVAGYRAGAAKLKEFVNWCDEVGLAFVTLWVPVSYTHLRA